VLKTSFNIHGEPLVCTPGEAVDVFLRSGADALAIGPFLVGRPA
jgi:carbamoyltransferase